LSSKHDLDTKNLQFMEHGKVWPNGSKEGFP
jgi:hypothetical protein